jgi:hypothetical protein
MQAMCQLQRRHDRFETGDVLRLQALTDATAANNFWKAKLKLPGAKPSGPGVVF